MDRMTTQSSDVLLARVNSELERISDTQHRLARRKQLLQHQATRLRLGASPIEVGLALRAAMLGEEERARLIDMWPDDTRTEANDQVDGSLL